MEPTLQRGAIYLISLTDLCIVLELLRSCFAPLPNQRIV